MKLVVAILCSIFAASSAMALTAPERAIVKHVQEVVKRQSKELEDVRAKLVWTDNELKNKQPEIDRLGAERDQYKMLYERDHEKMLKQAAHILKLYIIIGVMVLAIGVYLVAKFYFRLPI